MNVHRRGAIAHLWVAAFFTGVTGLILAGCGGSGAHYASSTGGDLTLAVVDLPEGSLASVVLKGPNGYHRVVDRSVTVGAAPGIYSVQVSPVAAGTDRYFPITDKTRVRIQDRHVSRVTVDYRIVVPDTTHQLSPAALKAVTYSATSSSLTFSRPLSEVAAIRPGNVLVINPIPSAPTGLLVKVIAVTRLGAASTIRVAPASLQEAIPRGSFDVRLSLSNEVASTTSQQVLLEPRPSSFEVAGIRPSPHTAMDIGASLS